MIEKTVFDFLTGKTNYPVFMEVPPNPPDQYYVIEKTGSSIEDHIKSATIVIQSVALSLYNAALMNEAVKTAMDGLIVDNSITRCELNSDYNFTDTETKQYRYQAVFDITHY